MIKKRKSLGEDFELSIPGGVPQVIHATKTVGEATTVEHVEFTAENWQRWIKDPEYSRMYTHPTTECVSPKEVVRRARREAGLE